MALDAKNLPFLPGYTFEGPKHTIRQGIKSTFDLKDGYQVLKTSGTGVPVVTEKELEDLATATARLTYQSPRTLVKDVVDEFVPAHVAFDKQVMTFNAFFEQIALDAPIKEFVRHVQIFYYLEDDTISVIEPIVENSGLLQGKFLKRQRVPKNTAGEFYQATDFNVGVTVTFYGTVFNIVSCNTWTKNYLESKGVVLKTDSIKPAPPDRHMLSRVILDKPDTKYQTPSDFDKLKQFIALDRKVLRFYAAWDDGVENGSGLRSFIIHYFLVNNTMEVREVHHANDSRDPFPVLLARQKVNRDFRLVPVEFPTIIMEVPVEGEDALEQISPADFRLGYPINIYGRDMLIYDCDEFTREFYRLNFGVTDFTPIDIQRKVSSSPKKELPPYTGFGSPEDSLGSVAALVPKPPKTDFLKQLEYDATVLRFAAHMDTAKYEDVDRKFILTYHLSSDKISIWEIHSKNSGFWGGKYLDMRKVETPNSNVNAPTYYTLKDFKLGATLEVYHARFVIDAADDFVVKYASTRPNLFSAEGLASFKK